MYVYMVMMGVEYEGCEVQRVYANREEAEQYKKELITQACNEWGCTEKELREKYGEFYYIQKEEVF